MNALDAIAFIAERKIEEAMAEGAFDNLPGLGKPLQLEDLSHMPADMRMAYTILKNSGCLDQTEQGARDGTGRERPVADEPASNGPQRSPRSMKELMSALPDEGRVYGKMQRLNVMMARVRRAETLFLPERPGKKEDAPGDSPYLEKLQKKV